VRTDVAKQQNSTNKILLSSITPGQSDCPLENVVLQHMPQVSLIAKRIRDRFSPNADLGDLVGYGVIGLMSAIERFDSSRGILLKTYAEYRIRGAILDGLRRMNWLSRTACRNKTAYRRRLAGKTAGDSEQSARTGNRAGLNPPLLEIICGGTELEALEQMSLRSRSGDIGAMRNDPAVLYERKEMGAKLVRAVSCLGPRDREVLDLYYQRGLNMQEIAELLSVHQSRVSQLHTAAIQKLRKIMMN
jgi:RNA polymerase sigma factor FliA